MGWGSLRTRDRGGLTSNEQCPVLCAGRPILGCNLQRGEQQSAQTTEPVGLHQSSAYGTNQKPLGTEQFPCRAPLLTGSPRGPGAAWEQGWVRAPSVGHDLGWSGRPWGWGCQLAAGWAVVGLETLLADLGLSRYTSMVCPPQSLPTGLCSPGQMRYLSHGL